MYNIDTCTVTHVKAHLFGHHQVHDLPYVHIKLINMNSDAGTSFWVCYRPHGAPEN